MKVVAMSFCLAAVVMFSGCAHKAPSKYEWGNYEQSMYDYYKNPSDPAALMASIEGTVKSAEATHRKVPPGMYAEYGYLLMLQGKPQEAVANFEKEKRNWPESAGFMDRMTKIALVKQADKDGVKQ